MNNQVVTSSINKMWTYLKNMITYVAPAIGATFSLFMLGYPGGETDDKVSYFFALLREYFLDLVLLFGIFLIVYVLLLHFNTVKNVLKQWKPFFFPKDNKLPIQPIFFLILLALALYFPLRSTYNLMGNMYKHAKNYRQVYKEFLLSNYEQAMASNDLTDARSYLNKLLDSYYKEESADRNYLTDSYGRLGLRIKQSDYFERRIADTNNGKNLYTLPDLGLLLTAYAYNPTDELHEKLTLQKNHVGENLNHAIQFFNAWKKGEKAICLNLYNDYNHFLFDPNVKKYIESAGPDPDNRLRLIGFFLQRFTESEYNNYLRDLWMYETMDYLLNTWRMEKKDDQKEVESNEAAKPNGLNMVY